jgi:hypothetical protein
MASLSEHASMAQSFDWQEKELTHIKAIKFDQNLHKKIIVLLSFQIELFPKL